jgi:hypothetical protein
MPLDQLMDWETPDEAFKRRCIGWTLERSFLPRRCDYTGKYLWLKQAYHGVSILTGPGDPIFDHRWCDKNEYLFLKIKGIV